MTDQVTTDFPPALVHPVHRNVLLGASGGEPGGTSESDADKTKRLTKLAWFLYGAGEFLSTTEDGLKKMDLGESAITAIDASIDSFVDLINSANDFLSNYVEAVKTGKWPPIDIPMPPHIDPNHESVSDITHMIEGAINSAILEFQDNPHGAEIAQALTDLENGLKDVVTTIKTYYPKLFD